MAPLHSLRSARWLPWALSIASLAFATPGRAGEAARYLGRPDDWYRGEEAKRVAANILSFQSPRGGWPKNTNTTAAPHAGDPAKLQPTFDNGATTDELRFLARVRVATAEPRYEQAFLRGLDYILSAQYPTGGWPQSYPPGPQYHRHITFNDGAMVRLMLFLREVAHEPGYAFVDASRRRAAITAFDRGIDCILRCQIRVNGKLTAWCAQHDEVTFEPRSGRTYELVSLSGSESVEIIQLLMSVERPSPAVINAVESAVAWLESAKLEGIRVERQPDPQSPKGTNKVIIADPAAPPLWARFYDIKTNQPIYCDRDGIPRKNLADIGYERRNGYAWLGDWPSALLSRDYPAWKRKITSVPVTQ